LINKELLNKENELNIQLSEIKMKNDELYDKFQVTDRKNKEIEIDILSSKEEINDKNKILIDFNLNNEKINNEKIILENKLNEKDEIVKKLKFELNNVASD
jgi:hypothetical protein